MKVRPVAPVRITVALLATVVAALGLLACGGSGSSSSSGGSTAASSTAAEASPAAAGQSTTASKTDAPAGRSGGSGLTPPGTELEPGSAATVAWVPPGSFEASKAQSGVELRVAVEAIEEGSKRDLKNIELEPDERGAVPFYVRLKIEAPGGLKVPADENPADTFTAIDDRDQEQASVTFLGTFEPCEETPVPKSFEGGDLYETCLTYLMNGGGSIQKVEWNSGPAKAEEVTPYFEHPIVWAQGRP